MAECLICNKGFPNDTGDNSSFDHNAGQWKGACSACRDDAATGKLAKAMPSDSILRHATSAEWVAILAGATMGAQWADTPREALEKAGVKA